ncbi:hypothetical protein H671_1g3855 [Cricetulus griseus]|nr:hypothetical protein H671_1g3855 [Cricetulus griseus]
MANLGCEAYSQSDGFMPAKARFQVNPHSGVRLLYSSGNSFIVTEGSRLEENINGLWILFVLLFKTVFLSVALAVLKLTL